MPEYSAATALALLSALAASIYLLRRRRVHDCDGGSRMSMSDYTTMYGYSGLARYVADRIRYRQHH